MPRNITFDELALKLGGATAIIEGAVKAELEHSAKLVKRTADEKFGHYQDSVAGGQFPAWSALSSEYLAEKIRKGGGDDPLIGVPSMNHLYSTSLKDTIQYTVQGHTAHIGTNDVPLATYHEFGTIHMPPRPFLRPALFQNREQIVKDISAAISVALVSYFK